MAKRNPTVKLSFEGVELNALISNAGAFENCDGLDDQLLRIHNVYLPKTKFSLTEPNFLEMYTGVVNTLGGIRYPNKSGNEYYAMRRVKEKMEYEFERQRGKSIDIQ